LARSPEDAGALAELDRVRAAYFGLCTESRAIALDDRHHAARVASQEKAARMRVRTRRLRARLEQRDHEIERLTAQAQETPLTRTRRATRRLTRGAARRLADRVARRVRR